MFTPHLQGVKIPIRKNIINMPIQKVNKMNTADIFKNELNHLITEYSRCQDKKVKQEIYSDIILIKNAIDKLNQKIPS